MTMDISVASDKKGDIRDKVTKLAFKSENLDEEAFLKALWDIYDKGGCVKFYKPTKKGKLQRKPFFGWAVHRNSWWRSKV